MPDKHKISEIIDCCESIMLDCPICDAIVPLTTRICGKCGIGIPNFDISENIDNAENSRIEGIEDIENRAAEARSDIVAIEKILQAGEGWEEEWDRSTKFRIFDDYENLKIPKPSDYIGVYRTRGIAYADLGEFERALNDFNEIIKYKLFAIKKLQDYCESKSKNLRYIVYRNLAFDYVRRGIVYSKIKKYDKAFNDFEQAVNLNFSLLNYKWGERGIGAGSIHNEGQFNKVIDNYNSYIEANPNDAYAYACRGFCLKYNHTNNQEQAIKDLSKAISLSANLHFAYYMRGYSHGYNFEKALEDFTCAISAKNDHAPSFLARGRIYYTLKEFGKTIEEFKAAIQIDPECACFRYDGVYTLYSSWLNRLYDKKSNGLKKIEKLSKDVLKNPHDASRYFKRGKAYYELGHFDASHYPAALADFNESLRIEPCNETVHVYRGLTLVELQQFDGAIEAISRALSLKPGYLFAYNSRGIAHYKKGDYIKAKDDFDQLPSFSGKDNVYYREMVQAKLIM